MELEKVIKKIESQIKELEKQKEELEAQKDKPLTLKGRLDFILKFGKEGDWLIHYNSNLIEEDIQNSLENGYKYSIYKLEDFVYDMLFNCKNFTTPEDYNKFSMFMGEEEEANIEIDDCGGHLSFEDAQEILEEIIEKEYKSFKLN